MTGNKTQMGEGGRQEKTGKAQSQNQDVKGKFGVPLVGGTGTYQQSGNWWKGKGLDRHNYAIHAAGVIFKGEESG